VSIAVLAIAPTTWRTFCHASRPRARKSLRLDFANTDAGAPMSVRDATANRSSAWSPIAT
jgi:hypothetical protein